MFDFVSTIAAALIGSVIGSVGAVLADHWLTGRTEKSHRREILVQRYLFQLQDALELLYYRLHNLTFRVGQDAMNDEYFEESTLYAFGRVLAIERIFAFEAVYPQLDTIYSGLGKFLKVASWSPFTSKVRGLYPSCVPSLFEQKHEFNKDSLYRQYLCA